MSLDGPQVEMLGYVLTVLMSLIGLAAIVATWRKSSRARAFGCLAFVVGLLVLCCGEAFVAGYVQGGVETVMFAMGKGVDPALIVRPRMELEHVWIPLTALAVMLIGAVTWPIGWRRQRRAHATR